MRMASSSVPAQEVKAERGRFEPCNLRFYLYLPFYVIPQYQTVISLSRLSVLLGFDKLVKKF